METKNFFDFLSGDVVTTEKGATMYSSKTIKNPIVEMSYKVSSYRKDDSKLIEDFEQAFYNNPVMAMKWLFFARDIRGGMGERKLFKKILSHLTFSDPHLVEELIPFIADYGRFDDLFCLFDTPVEDYMMNYCLIKLSVDYNYYRNGDLGKISLLAKWMPSENASSIVTTARARKFIKMLSVPAKEYRQALSALRKGLDVVECKMSANKWEKINFGKVPSRAMLRYKDAFSKRQPERYSEFIDNVGKGKEKINALTLYPHEIAKDMDDCIQTSLYRYRLDRGERMQDIDNEIEMETLNQLWAHLPNYETADNTLVVADLSGSMTMGCGSATPTPKPIDVSRALAIYFAERGKGAFKDKCILFSSQPSYVEFPEGKFSDKMEHILKFNDYTTTDIYKVFKLVLDTAIHNQLTQGDLPERILVISDMEFDNTVHNEKVALFERIRNEYAMYSYRLPQLIFWNVCSRTQGVPFKNSEEGTMLLSGFSPAVMDIVMTGQTDMTKALYEVLNRDRYAPIDAITTEYIREEWF